MISVQFPEPNFNIRGSDRGDEIFDTIRKKWLLLTPEEWVRQNLCAYLVQVQNIPEAFIALERKILVGELNRRFDLVVYNREMTPWMLAECKAMNVSLTEKTISQAIGYCSAARVKYLLISNGHFTYLWHMVLPDPLMLPSFPEYKQ